MGKEGRTPKLAEGTAYERCAVCVPTDQIAEELRLDQKSVLKALEALKRHSVALPESYTPSQFTGDTYPDRPHMQIPDALRFEGGYVVPLVQPMPKQRGHKNHAGVYVVNAPNDNGAIPRRVYKRPCGEVAEGIRSGRLPNPFAHPTRARKCQ